MELICEQCGKDVGCGPLTNGRCGLCHYEATGEGVIIDCVECGKPWHCDDPDYEPWRERIAASLCHKCHFWTVHAANADDPWSVRVAGKHYRIVPEGQGPGGGLFQGHGGKEFVVEFLDGRQTTTRNLWCQGMIPEHFSGRLPDNARFIKLPAPATTPQWRDEE